MTKPTKKKPYEQRHVRVSLAYTIVLPEVSPGLPSWLSKVMQDGGVDLACTGLQPALPKDLDIDINDVRVSARMIREP